MATTMNLGRVKGSMWYTGTVDGNDAIANAISQAGYKPLQNDLYLNTTNGNLYAFVLTGDTTTWTLRGNIRGAAGEGFSISKTYPSVEAMNAGFATDDVPFGGFVIIETGDVNDEDNAKLYYKGDTKYEYLTDMSGAQGIQGPKGDPGAQGPIGPQGYSVTAVSVSAGTAVPGGMEYALTFSLSNNTSLPAVRFVAITGAKGADGIDGTNGKDGKDGQAATVTVGTTTTVSPATSASVTNSGTANAAIFNFNIPKGETGEKGDKGDKGDPGATGAPGADGKTPEFSMNDLGELIATYN